MAPEASALKSRVSALSAELDSVRKERDSFARQLTEATLSAKRAAEDSGPVREHALKAESTIIEQRKKLEAAESEALDLRARLASMVEQTGELQSLLREETRRADELAKDRSRLTSQLHSLAERMESMGARMDQLRSSAGELDGEELGLLRARVRELEGALATRISERDMLLEAGQVAVQEAERMDRELEAAAAERDRLAAEVHRMATDRAAGGAPSEDIQAAMATAVREYDALSKKKDAYKTVSEEALHRLGPRPPDECACLLAGAKKGAAGAGPGGGGEGQGAGPADPDRRAAPQVPPGILGCQRWCPVTFLLRGALGALGYKASCVAFLRSPRSSDRAPPL